MRRVAMLTAAVLMVGLPAAAEDRAVAVVQQEYDKFGKAEAPDAEALFRALRASGMRVTSGTDLVARDVRVALDDLSRPDPQPGTRIVVLTGRFVNSASDTWLLASDAATPTLATVDLNGMALSAVLDLIRDGGDRSVLLLGDASGGVNPGARLSDGIGRIGAMSDGYVIAGPPQAIASAAVAMSLAEITAAEVLRNDSSLRLVQGGGADGAPPNAQPVVVDATGSPAAPVVADPPARPSAAPPAPVVVNPGPSVGPPPPIVVGPPAGPPKAEGRVLEGEAEAWVLAAARNSAASYEEFLRAFPEGRYADVARMRLTQWGGVMPAPPAKPAPAATPAPSAAPSTPAAQPSVPTAQSVRLAEIGMNLSRSERVRIQEHLTRLGYDTRGIDGIFGNGTRAALTRWQRDNGLPATGYLDAGAVAKLKAQADVRGRQGAASERQGGAAAAQREVDWQEAVKGNSIASYNSFAANYPDSPEAEKARNRVRWLTANKDEIEGERKLGLTRDTRRLIEERLEAAGMKLGKADGTFDNATRQALRAYQQSRDLPVTGFINENTVLNLLAEALLAR